MGFQLPTSTGAGLLPPKARWEDDFEDWPMQVRIIYRFTSYTYAHWVSWFFTAVYLTHRVISYVIHLLSVWFKWPPFMPCHHCLWMWWIDTVMICANIIWVSDTPVNLVSNVPMLIVLRNRYYKYQISCLRDWHSGAVAPTIRDILLMVQKSSTSWGW